MTAPSLIGDINQVVRDCITFLRSKPFTEFLFRVQGTPAKVDGLIAAYEKGLKNVLSDELSNNDVTTLLKRYLKDTEKELFPPHGVKRLLAKAAKYSTHGPAPEKNRQFLQDSVREFLSTLGADSFEVITSTLSYLNFVAEHQSETNMSSYALAVCMAPVLFMKYISEDQMRDAIHVIIFVTNIMIDNAEVYLRNSPVQKSKKNIMPEAVLGAAFNASQMTSGGGSFAPVQPLVDFSEDRQEAWLRSFDPYQSRESREFQLLAHNKACGGEASGKMLIDGTQSLGLL